jgi:predicted AlkP superfamily pyrophosphatase or phosphodiesterase
MKQPVLSAALALLCAAAPLHARRLAEHVFIISFDGGKPAVIAATEMPVLKKLAAEGACTWAASTIIPPITLPSHTSMLTGVGPDKHHILWNNYDPARGKCGVPTIFTLAKRSDPALSTAMFVGKMKFRHLWQPGSLDLFDFNGPQEDKPAPATGNIETSIQAAQAVAKNAAPYIIAKKPNLCFIHFADPDSIGHKSGWGSPEQQAAFRSCDQALGQIVQAIRQAGIADSSVLIITADHGGHAKTHGENIPDDMHIPWIAWGAGVKKHNTITVPVTTYDTAATALWLLDVKIPAEFDGKPVKAAFEFAK